MVFLMVSRVWRKLCISERACCVVLRLEGLSVNENTRGFVAAVRRAGKNQVEENMLEPRQHVLRGREMLNKNAYSEVMVKEQKCWTIVFSPNSLYLASSLSAWVLACSTVLCSVQHVLWGLYLPS